MRTYTLIEAATRCGYRRPNTFREKHLKTQNDRTRYVRGYDGRGRLQLDADAVDALADRLEITRLKNGNWRLKNLGAHANAGRRQASRSRSQDT